jgi:hypothetical protein
MDFNSIIAANESARATAACCLLIWPCKLLIIVVVVVVSQFTYTSNESYGISVRELHACSYERVIDWPAKLRSNN